MQSVTQSPAGGSLTAWGLAMRPNARFALALRPVLAVAWFVVPTACVIAPTPEISEIRDSRLDFITPGVTIRASLESEILSRDVFLARESRPYVIYAEYRSKFGIVDITSGAGNVYGDVDDYLVVEYDADDRVVRFDRLRREGECTSYGLCVRGGSTRNRRDEESRKTPDTLVVFAPTAADAAAKRFDADAGSCSVYAFTKGARRCDSVAVDISNNTTVPNSTSSPPTRTDFDGFFHWSLPLAGRSSAAGFLFAEDENGRLSDHDYDCTDGENLFIEIYLSSCVFDPPRASFIPLTASEGEDEIFRRRLILE